ncbi:MAG TPA: TrkH family potassium uptake protein, partial [Thermopetrobacter sp.]|nr:TrkH family potassium uptake protein [Thermopetrobacter sp.]
MRKPRMSWKPFAGGESSARRGGMTVDIYRILFAVGMLILLLAVAMLPPLLVDLLRGSSDWQVFALSMAITAFTGMMMVLVSRDAATPVMHVREGFLLTLASWLAVSLFAALPYLLRGDLAPASAWFEAVSGLTTTGSTVFTGLDSMPPGILLWRSLTQW